MRIYNSSGMINGYVVQNLGASADGTGRIGLDVSSFPTTITKFLVSAWMKLDAYKDQNLDFSEIIVDFQGSYGPLVTGCGGILKTGLMNLGQGGADDLGHPYIGVSQYTYWNNVWFQSGVIGAAATSGWTRFPGITSISDGQAGAAYIDGSGNMVVPRKGVVSCNANIQYAPANNVDISTLSVAVINADTGAIMASNPGIPLSGKRDGGSGFPLRYVPQGTGPLRIYLAYQLTGTVNGTMQVVGDAYGSENQISNTTEIDIVAFTEKFPADGNWHHILLAGDLSLGSSGIKGYIDGVALTPTAYKAYWNFPNTQQVGYWHLMQTPWTQAHNMPIGSESPDHSNGQIAVGGFPGEATEIVAWYSDTFDFIGSLPDSLDWFRLPDGFARSLGGTGWNAFKGEAGVPQVYCTGNPTSFISALNYQGIENSQAATINRSLTSTTYWVDWGRLTVGNGLLPGTSDPFYGGVPVGS